MLVASQPRKPAEARPITMHPLFPAVIALWFGALFGLGSLAVRPALLESLIIQSRIDLILAAAAPPIGMTARILVALVLTAIGSAVGLTVARRLVQPKMEVHEHKRSTMFGHPVEEQPRNRTAYVEPSLRSALPVADEVDANGAPEAGGLTQRRRALTMEKHEREITPCDQAPLPGGAPQILDISLVGMASASADDQRTNSGRLAVGPASIDEFTVPDDRPISGVIPQAATSDNRKAEFAISVGFESSAFAAPEPNPLFAPRALPLQATPGGSAIDPQVAAAPPAPAIDAQAPAPVDTDVGLTALADRLIKTLASRRAARCGTVEVAVTALDETASPTAPEAQSLPAASVVPMAMRPLDLDGFEENDGDLATLIPPRHIPTPVPFGTEAFGPDVEPIQTLSNAEPEDAEPEAEPEMAETDYASLLGIAKSAVPAPSFARIGKPDVEAGTTEPVVIFPGQMIRQPEITADASEFHCSDSLRATEQGAPIEAGRSDLETGHTGAEHALQTALTNLRRLSGAG